ncbi:MAG: pilus assembly protein PilP [Desulfuromonadales bacterium]|nr:pilus assembly protein PilP [Desulfuromonadales bacterium]
MMRWCWILSLTLFVLGALAGCAEEPAPPPAASAAKAAVKPAAKAAPPQPAEEVEAEAPKEEKYVYQAIGRRDPFVPLTAMRKVVESGDEPLTPLQGYELTQYRLTALLVGFEEPRAVVSAPDNKTYILKRGMKIGKNGGVIVKIDSRTVLVEEKYYDFSGNVRTIIQEISIAKR